MQNDNSKKIYDLEKRTLEFSKRILSMARAIPKNRVNLRLTDQVVRSGTSVGANYREANETETKKDFKFRARICKKEAKETTYWLDLIIDENPGFKQRIIPLVNESTELMKIFAAIIRNSK